jgi:hypothetical protein
MTKKKYKPHTKDCCLTKETINLPRGRALGLCEKCYRFPAFEPLVAEAAPLQNFANGCVIMYQIPIRSASYGSKSLFIKNSCFNSYYLFI